MHKNSPVVTIAIPSLNQGQFLEQALCSIQGQGVEVEIMVADAGSSDGTLEIINRWAPSIKWWRSSPDDGQAAAINEAISKGTAPYVCWLNTDDVFLPEGLDKLVGILEEYKDCDVVYGRCWKRFAEDGFQKPYLTGRFSEKSLAVRCLIAQPATLIRRSAWEQVGGIDTSLDLAFDYDLWWRIYNSGGQFHFLDEYVAMMVMHSDMKTSRLRSKHNREAMSVVKKHYGSLPIKWFLAWPFRVFAWKLFWRIG